MAISERVSPDNLNIHQFQEAPEGRPELPFDVDRDIGPEMKQQIMDSFTNADVQSFLLHWWTLKMLWPNDEIIINHTIEELLGQIEKSTRPDVKLYMIAALKLMKPELKVDLPKSDQDYEMDLESYKIQGSWISYIKTLAKLRIINPDYKHKLDLTDVSSILENTNSLRKEGRYTELAELLNYLKIVDPNMEINLNQYDWREFIRALENTTNNRWRSYVYLAASLKILAAHSVKVTAPGVIGIQMYPPEDLNQSTPPIPETRKF